MTTRYGMPAYEYDDLYRQILDLRTQLTRGGALPDSTFARGNGIARSSTRAQVGFSPLPWSAQSPDAMTQPLPSGTSQPLALKSQSTAGARDSVAARIRQGDEQVFASLFLEHYASLCDFVDSFVRAPDVAEEVVQSVFLRIWEGRRSWSPEGDARAYLFAACRNRALDLLRHEQIVTRSAEEAAELDSSRWNTLRMADADLEAAELSERLRAVVARLPERRRLVVVLRWQHQLSNPEIARVLGISVKGVEMHFSRALADLRRHLAGRSLDFV